MAYIKFDKKQLINLEYSLNREVLRTNRAGAYSCTTIVNCNTRKYHGLLIVSQPQFGNAPHVLLSSFHETIVQQDAEFNLGIQRYPGNVYQPKGHKYVRDFEMDPTSCITWRVGGAVLQREMLFSESEDLLMLKYTLVDAHSPTTLKFKPFVAFRNIHALSKANPDASNEYHRVKNGIEITLYEGYTPLVLQFSKQAEYIHQPDWYYNIEYAHEKARGYDHQEDLYVPGNFNLSLRKGESIIVAAGSTEIIPASLKQKFSREAKRRISRKTFKSCLQNAADQFIINREDKTEILAGYPWFGSIGRDTFISLVGLLLIQKDKKKFHEILQTMISRMQGPFFPGTVLNDRIEYNTVDTQLWFFWALQKYSAYIGETDKNWGLYKETMVKILDAYAEGTWFNIKMDSDALLYAGELGFALTWMNAVIDGKPVTPRAGKPVEVNALWYNAMKTAIYMAMHSGDNAFVKKWKPVVRMLETEFVDAFWDEKRGYLADCVGENDKDWAVRPNMLLAVSLPFSPLDDLQKKMVLDVVEKELLTPRGLRTLSPRDPKYKGVYRGSVAQRDEAYHNGSVMPWLVGNFAEAYLRIYGKAGLPVVKNLYKAFEPEMQEYGIGTISELFDGDPPHKPSGAVSMAAAVAELMRVEDMIIRISSGGETDREV